MNIFQNIIEDYQNENFDTLLDLPNIRIERIVSNGQSSENNFWYDQDENEWILLIKGDAELEYKTGEIIQLEKGDYEFIPKNKMHRVNYTSSEETTIWLAIFFK